MRALLPELLTQLCFIANRLGTYAMLNLVDDPALLALAFC